MVIVVIPVLEIIGEALVAVGEAIAANAVPAAIGTGTAGVIIVASQHASSNSTPATGTTTIVGSGDMKCGENGKYGDLLNKTADGKLDRDHVPSKAALKRAAEKIIADNDIELTPSQMKALFGTKYSPGLIAEEGEAIAIPKSVHQQHSDTYGGRNKPAKIETDSKELQEAAKKDTKKIEESEGKDMDDECLEKYKKAAEKIRKKTHDEYIKDLTALINKVLKTVK
jgi:hypothetical protein